jgi:alpha-beta hydrolase superfamily lysophospholipase
MTSRPRTRVGLSVLVIIAVLVGGSILNLSRRYEVGVHEQKTDGLFYTLPTPLAPGAPGEIIRKERINSAPLGSTAWRVIYHSRDQTGTDIAVSGIVVVPDLPAPAGGRTVVSWAHPTTGAAPQCAPSLSVDPFFTMEGVHELLAAGFVVAATDYPGMGVVGQSSYLLGVPESNSVLDAARAARNIPQARASSKLVLWGHSQGGQAALIAAERAHSYAPELSLEGVAVAAPAANLRTLMTDDIINISGTTIASLAIPAYEDAYGSTYTRSAITAILSPAGYAATPSMAALCLLTQTKAIHAIAGPLVGHYVTSDPATTEPWQTMLAENSAGTDIPVPVYVGQGLADKLVIPTATEAYVRSLCEAGVDVSFHRFPGITHALAAYAALPTFLPWLEQVTHGTVPASTC